MGQKPKNVLQLVKEKGNKEVIEVMELLLDEAKAGNLIGIAGVFEMRSKSGQLCYGTCGERPGYTLVSIGKLVDQLQA